MFCFFSLTRKICVLAINKAVKRKKEIFQASYDRLIFR